MSRPPRLPRRPHAESPLTPCLGFGRKIKVPSCLPGRSTGPAGRPRMPEWPGWDGPAYSSHPLSRCSSPKEERHMTALVMLLMTTGAPSAGPVAQPPPASWASPGDEGPPAGGRPRRCSRLRALFSHRPQGPQQQPACACGAPPGGPLRPVPVAVSGAPSAAGPIAPPVITSGPGPSSADPAVTVSPAPTTPPQQMPSAGPVTFPAGTTGPSPALSSPEVTTPPAATPAMRPMPSG
jgi:hypothetical protein